MLCEKCKKKDASFFYNENINGQKRSFALCDDCAREMKKSGELAAADSVFDSAMLPFSSVADGFFGNLFGLGAPLDIKESKKLCPHCGASFDDFRKHGKAGCSKCYGTFADELRGTLRSIHGSAKHTGKAPLKAKEKMSRENRLKALKDELRNAIQNEEFEKAAKLRDSIREIECKE